MNKRILAVIKAVKAMDNKKLSALIITFVVVSLVAGQVLYTSAKDGFFKAQNHVATNGYEEALAISNVASSVSENSATITWTTNRAATSTVVYGTTTSYGSTQTSTTLTTSHSVTLSSLDYETVYNYRVSSTDASNNTATGTNNTFTTGAQWVKSNNLKAQARIKEGTLKTNWTLTVKQKKLSKVTYNGQSKTIANKKYYYFQPKNAKGKNVKKKVSLELKMLTRYYYTKNYKKPKNKLMLLVQKGADQNWEAVPNVKFSKTGKYAHVKLKYVKHNYKFALVKK